MGSFAYNWHVRAESTAAVVAALAEIFDELGYEPATWRNSDKSVRSLEMSNERRALRIAEIRQGWVSVLDSNMVGAPDIARRLSQRLSTYAICVAVNDSDSWHYDLFHLGASIDEFSSVPEDFDDEEFDVARAAERAGLRIVTSDDEDEGGEDEHGADRPLGEGLRFDPGNGLSNGHPDGAEAGDSDLDELEPPTSLNVISPHESEDDDAADASDAAASTPGGLDLFGQKLDLSAVPPEYRAVVEQQQKMLDMMRQNPMFRQLEETARSLPQLTPEQIEDVRKGKLPLTEINAMLQQSPAFQSFQEQIRKMMAGGALPGLIAFGGKGGEHDDSDEDDDEDASEWPLAPPLTEEEMDEHFERLRPILATAATQDRVHEVFARDDTFAEEGLEAFLPLLGLPGRFAYLSYRYQAESSPRELAREGIRLVEHLTFQRKTTGEKKKRSKKKTP